MFSGGPPQGPTLLLKKLRGEQIDWKAIEDQHTPNIRCRGPCMAVRFKDEFSEKEWRNKEDSHCKECITTLQEDGKTHRCSRCRRWFPRNEFSLRSETVRHVCSGCNDKGLRKCMLCEVEKPQSQFSSTRWGQVLKRRICLECSGDRTCTSCHRRGGAEKFAREEWKKADDVRQCKDCVPMRCCKCRKAKAKGQYTKEQWKEPEGTAICNDCNRKRCGLCNKAKTYQDFDPSVWDMADGSAEHCCRECTRGRNPKGMWMCNNRRCKLQKPISDFSMARATHGDKVEGNSRVCDVCIRKRMEEEAQMAMSSSEQVQRKARKKSSRRHCSYTSVLCFSSLCFCF